MFHLEEADHQYDDCYFYYYSTCRKGELCQFRHCETALGTEMVCSDWQVGKCSEMDCPLRHMDSQKDRSTIACYWENQPGGCRKPHCVFKHLSQRGRIDQTRMNLTHKAKLILPTGPSEDWSMGEPNAANRVPSEARQQSRSHAWVDPYDGDESDSLPHMQLPAVSPLVVPLGEESDSEGYTVTPPSAIREMPKVIPIRRLNLINRLEAVAVDNKQDLGIKTLHEIRREKSKHSNESSNSDGTSQDEEMHHEANALDKEVQTKDSHISVSTTNDARPLPAKKRTKIALLPKAPRNEEDDISGSNNFGFKIKTLEEIRWEKAQSSRPSSSNRSSASEKELVAATKGETKENKAGNQRKRITLKRDKPKTTPEAAGNISFGCDRTCNSIPDDVDGKKQSPDRRTIARSPPLNAASNRKDMSDKLSRPTKRIYISPNRTKEVFHEQVKVKSLAEIREERRRMGQGETLSPTESVISSASSAAKKTKADAATVYGLLPFFSRKLRSSGQTANHENDVENERRAKGADDGRRATQKMYLNRNRDFSNVPRSSPTKRILIQQKSNDPAEDIPIKFRINDDRSMAATGNPIQTSTPQAAESTMELPSTINFSPSTKLDNADCNVEETGEPPLPDSSVQRLGDEPRRSRDSISSEDFGLKKRGGPREHRQSEEIDDLDLLLASDDEGSSNGDCSFADVKDDDLLSQIDAMIDG